MAKLQCAIQYDEQTETAQVTYTVLKVDKDDEIVFTSSDSKTAIKYEKRSPFTGATGPQAGTAFPVGKKAGPFKVTIPSNGKPRHFVCGETQASKAVGVGQSNATTKQGPFKAWAGGGDTP
jgi:hypothetical protein